MKKDKQLANNIDIDKSLNLCLRTYQQLLKRKQNSIYKSKNSVNHNIQSDHLLHKMEIEMKCLDFSFLEIEKMSDQVENESLYLYINFLKGE